MRLIKYLDVKQNLSWCFSVQMWCGPRSCKLGAKGRGGCPPGQSCLPLREGHCFVKPCAELGECWRPNSPQPPVKCHPSSSYQDSSCANITFTLKKETMPQVSYPGNKLLGSFFFFFSAVLVINYWRQQTVKNQVFRSSHLPFRAKPDSY